MFYVAPRVSTTPLEQLFRVRVIQMLVEEELLAPELARKLLGCLPGTVLCSGARETQRLQRSDSRN
jgi:hypothetical protein